MKVYVVLGICDDEYFCREVLFIGSTKAKAEEWVERHGGFYDVMGWDDVSRPYYLIEGWQLDM